MTPQTLANLPVKVLLLSHVGMNIYIFRRTLIEKLVSNGVKVFVALPNDNDKDRIEALGAELICYPMPRASLNPLHLIRAISTLRMQIRNNDIQLLHSFTHQPNLLARLTAPRGVKVVNSVTGLGSLFLGSGPTGKAKAQIMSLGYKVTSSRCHLVVFQNSDDHAFFTGNGLVAAGKSAVVRGSGVDLQRFSPDLRTSEEAVRLKQALGIEPDKTMVTMAARLIKDKGVPEFLEAVSMLRQQHPEALFLIVGEPDPGNPSSLDQEAINRAKAQGGVIFAGWREDMPMVWAVSDIAVLPSHREGLPVSLQEACAAGLPIVTTNAPGCREIVKEHETGYLVDVGDTKALASSIAKFLADERLRKEFGERGRKRAEELFDAGKLADQVIKLYCNMPD